MCVVGEGGDFLLHEVIQEQRDFKYCSPTISYELIDLSWTLQTQLAGREREKARKITQLSPWLWINLKVVKPFCIPLARAQLYSNLRNKKWSLPVNTEEKEIDYG